MIYAFLDVQTMRVDARQTMKGLRSAAMALAFVALAAAGPAFSGLKTRRFQNVLMSRPM